MVSVAVIGATGNLGESVGKAVAKKFKAIIITRKETLEKKASLFKEYKDLNASVVGIDTSDEDQLTDALKGADVLVSVVGGEALATQSTFIKAAKRAGVKTFYPSEFGYEDFGLASYLPHPLVDLKRNIRKQAVDAGLEVVVAYTGFFVEWAVSPFYSFNFEQKTVEVVGDGNQKFGLTRIEDIGKVVAAAIDSQVIKDLVPVDGVRYFSAHGVVVTYNDIIAIHSKNTGIEWKKTFVPLSEIKSRYEKADNKFAVFGEYLKYNIYSGAALTKDNIISKLGIDYSTDISTYWK